MRVKRIYFDILVWFFISLLLVIRLQGYATPFVLGFWYFLQRKVTASSRMRAFELAIFLLFSVFGILISLAAAQGHLNCGFECSNEVGNFDWQILVSTAILSMLPFSLSVYTYIGYLWESRKKSKTKARPKK